MKVKDFINKLKISSIRGLAVGSSEQKAELREQQFLMWTGLALDRIYSDLQLSQNGIELDIISGKEFYKLPDNSAGIICCRIVGEIEDLPLNDSDKEHSLFTQRPKEIYVPIEYYGYKINVYYNETPEPITLESELPLENIFTQAMIYYVAYLANEMVHGSPNWEHQSFLTKYNNEIMRLKIAGHIPNRAIVNYNFKMNGFV